jgi:hypothetical protein
MVSLRSDEDWSALRALLPSQYEQLANEHRQLQTQYGNAKFTTADWLLRFILLHVGANLPLRQTVALMAEAGGPVVSAMRLHMKMRRATPYLQALVEKMVTWTAEAKPELWAGYSLVLIDGSSVCKPGSSGTDALIHLKLRAADVMVQEVIVTDVHRGETLKHFYFQPGELVVADRMYSNHVNIAHALEHGADVLVRYNRGALPLLHLDEPMDVLAHARTLQEVDETLDLPVRFEHDDERISGRLIVTRLPADKADKARKRLRKEYGTSVSKETLEAAAYVMVFTTVARDRMSAERCLQAYRLRWQIELQFKRWKSLCGLDRLPNYRDDTIAAWLYAKVLLGILLDRMGSIRGELSPPEQLQIPLKPRRRPLAADGAAALEDHQRALSAAAQRPAPIVAQ